MVQQHKLISKHHFSLSPPFATFQFETCHKQRVLLWFWMMLIFMGSFLHVRAMIEFQQRMAHRILFLRLDYESFEIFLWPLFFYVQDSRRRLYFLQGLSLLLQYNERAATLCVHERQRGCLQCVSQLTIANLICIPPGAKTWWTIDDRFMPC